MINNLRKFKTKFKINNSLKRGPISVRVNYRNKNKDKISTSVGKFSRGQELRCSRSFSYRKSCKELYSLTTNNYEENFLSCHWFDMNTGVLNCSPIIGNLKKLHNRARRNFARHFGMEYFLYSGYNVRMRSLIYQAATYHAAFAPVIPKWIYLLLPRARRQLSKKTKKGYSWAVRLLTAFNQWMRKASINKDGQFFMDIVNRTLPNKGNVGLSTF